MANRNVDLLIRARDNASRAFQSVSDAIEEMGAIQEDVAAKSGKTNAALASTQAAAQKAGQALGADIGDGAAKAAAVMERVEKTLASSTQQFNTQEAQLGENRAAYSALERQAESAAAAIQRSEARIGPQTEAQTARVKAMAAGYRAVQNQIKTLEPRLAKQAQALAANAVELDRTRSAAIAVKAALRGINDSASAADAANQQTRLAASFRQAFAAAEQARSPIRRVVDEVTRIGPAAAGGATGMARLNREMSSGRRAFGAFYGDSRKALSLMQRLRGEALSLTASVVGFYAVFEIGQDIFDSFSKLEAAQNRLGAAFDQDYVRVNDEMARLQEESARLGISFDTLADNYSKFIISGQQAGLGINELRKTFTQVAEAGRVLKLSNEQIEGTFNALTQIAGKGTLQMEELRQQLGDRIPGAVGIMAAALGYGTDELAQFYKDVENGAISADDALVAFGKGLEDTFGAQLADALDSTVTKVGALENLLFQRKITAANGGFIAGLDEALDALNEFLDSEDGIAFFEALGAAFGKLFQTIPVLLNNLDELSAVFKGFVALKVAQTAAQFAAGMSTMTKATVGQLRVQVAMNRALASMSPSAASALRSTTALGAGLHGLTALAARATVAIRSVFLSFGGVVGIAAAALSYFALDSLTQVDTEARTTTATLEAHEEILRSLRTAYRDAGEGADSYAEKLKNISSIDARANIEALNRELAALRDQESPLEELREFGRTAQGTLRSRVSSVLDRDLVDLLIDYEKGFRANQVSAADFLEVIDMVNESLPDLMTAEQLKRVQDFAKEGLTLEESLLKAEAALREIEGTASAADRELLGLVETTDQAGKKADEAADTYTKFEAAMRELAKQVPSLNRELEKFDAIAKIETSFQNALTAARALPDAIQRIAASQEALQTKDLALQGLAAESVAGFTGTDGASVAAAVLRDSEGFRANPYNDPRTDRNGKQVGPDVYRVGYGSDTITLSDGTIQKVTRGMTVSVGDANRDLLRRIQTEFLPTARRQVGAERFDSFNAQQQAALVSIAYNYGELPDRILGAVRTGTREEASAAIRGLRGDNGGINDGRRDKEAALFSSRAGESSAIAEQVKSDARRAEEAAKEIADAEEERLKAATRLKESQDEYLADQQAGLAQTQFETSLEGKRIIDAEVAKALREAEIAAQKVGLSLTQEQRAEIEAATRAKYATAQAEADANTQREQGKKLEEEAALLVSKRQFLLEQMSQMEAQGDVAGLARTQEELAAVEEQLENALEKAIAFWEALGGPGSDAAIQALQTTQQEIQKVQATSVTTGKEINEMISNRATQAFQGFTQRISEGEHALSAFKNEFLQMAGDILIQIGQMIIQQAIFNALSGAFGGGVGGGGGIGGLIAGGINKIFHKGGVVGGGSPNSGRAISASQAANATRYHSGGIVGFAPDEYSAILKKNEEVLTEEDPRHRFNGGAAAGASSSEQPVEIYNLIDSGRMIREGLKNKDARRAIMNLVDGRNTGGAAQ